MNNIDLVIVMWCCIDEYICNKFVSYNFVTNKLVTLMDLY